MSQRSSSRKPTRSARSRDPPSRSYSGSVGATTSARRFMPLLPTPRPPASPAPRSPPPRPAAGRGGGRPAGARPPPALGGSSPPPPRHRHRRLHLHDRRPLGPQPGEGGGHGLVDPG